MTHGGAELGIIVAMAAAGTLHCAGMCGGLAILINKNRSRHWLAGMLLYLTGKLAAYIFLGALAGALGERIIQTAPSGGRVLALAGGLIMLGIGLHSLGLFGRSVSSAPGLTRITASMAGFAREAGFTGKLLLGSANGLLPCPLVYAFLAIAASRGSIITGAGVMGVLGIVSAVPLAICSGLGYKTFQLKRFSLPMVGALLTIAMGVLTMYRGLAGQAAHSMH